MNIIAARVDDGTPLAPTRDQDLSDHRGREASTHPHVPPPSRTPMPGNLQVCWPDPASRFDARNDHFPGEYRCSPSAKTGNPAAEASFLDD